MKISFRKYFFACLLVVDVFTLKAFAGIPSSISNLTAIAGSNLGEIVLSWTAPGGDGEAGTADGYQVRFSTASQIEDDITADVATDYINAWVPSISGTAETFIATGLVPGDTYYWCVRAFHAANGTGTWSRAGGINSLTWARAQFLSPLSWSVDAVASSDSIKWAWNDIAEEDGFRLFNSTSSENISSDLSRDTTFYIQSGLQPNTTYQVFLQAFALTTTLDSGATVQVTLATTPVNLVSPSQTNRSLTLQWNGNGNPSGTIFDLERSLNGTSGWMSVGRGEFRRRIYFGALSIRANISGGL